MVKRVIYILIFIACAISVVQANSVSFTSEHIEEIYRELPKNESGEMVDSIDSFQIRVTQYDSQIKDLGVRIDNLEFDNPEIKKFVERKVLELLLAKGVDDVSIVLDHSKCRLIYNGLDFSRGLDWELHEGLSVLKQFTSYMYRNDDSFHYIEIKDGVNVLEILFPVNIQIMTDRNKRELELELEDLMRLGFDVDIYEKEPTKSRYNKLDDIYLSSTKFLYDESINNATYYDFDGAEFTPLFSSDHAVESFVNLFHFANDNTSKIDLVVMQHLYGNQERVYTVTLDKLIAYCRANNADVYVGIEKKEEEMLNACVLLDCKAMKCLHILHVRGDLSTLFESAKDDERRSIFVNLYAYVPTDNIGNLFEDNNYQERHNKFIILK